jgi:hypothetical protein
MLWPLPSSMGKPLATAEAIVELAPQPALSAAIIGKAAKCHTEKRKVVNTGKLFTIR